MKPNSILFLFCSLSILILTCSSQINAQFKNKKYQSEAIYLKGNKYISNGIEYRLGFLNVNLKHEMQISPNAVIEYSNYEKKRNSALAFATIGLAGVVSALFVSNRNAQVGLALGGLGATIISLPLSLKANNSLQKAIWIRNGEILN